MNKIGTRMQIRLHVTEHSWPKQLALRDPRGALWRGVRGHISNCGKTATNTCIIMLRVSLAKPGNSASPVNNCS